jgi:O-antigen ligase
MASIRDIKYSSFRKFFKDILIALIIVFSFSISFSPDIGKFLINQMFYIWLLSVDIKRILSIIKNNLLFSSILIFVLWIVISYFWSSNHDQLFYIERVIKYLLLPLIIIVTTIKIKHIKYIIFAFLLSMFINEVISYGIFFDLWNSIFGFYVTGSKHDPVPFQTSHMEYSVFVALSILLLLYSFINTKNKYLKFISAFFTITMTINLFLSAGRSGQFTLLVAGVILIVIYFRKHYKLLFLSCLLLIMTFILAFNFSKTFHSRTIAGYNDIKSVIDNENYYSSLGIRLSSYYLIPTFIDEVPVLYGTGFCVVNQVVHKMHMKHFDKNSTFKHQRGHLHNSYITIYVGTGLIGLVLLLFVWFLIFKLKIKDKKISYIKYSYSLILFFAGFTENMFRQKETMFLFALFTSIIIVQNYYESHIEKKINL